MCDAVIHTEALRLRTQGMKAGQRTKRTGSKTYRATGGGHGQYLQRSEIYLCFRLEGTAVQLIITDFFRDYYREKCGGDGKITEKRLKKIKETMPDTVRVSQEGEGEDECLVIHPNDMMTWLAKL